MTTFDKDELELEAELAEELNENEIEESYKAYLDNIDDPGDIPTPDAEERMVNWDDDEYEYFCDDDKFLYEEMVNSYDRFYVVDRFDVV